MSDKSKKQTCLISHVMIEGKIYKRLWGYMNSNYPMDGRTCHDCNMYHDKEHKNFHHPGCDMEPCPVHPDKQFFMCCYHKAEYFISMKHGIINEIKWKDNGWARQR